MNRMEHLFSAQQLVRTELQETEHILEQIRAEFDGPMKSLGDHVLTSQGKRLRPTILLLSSKLDGRGGVEHAPLVAAVVELIHTATLIHDDSIDEAEIRRGKVSVHVQWNHHVATMLGDVLYLRAFQMLMDNEETDIAHLMTRASHIMARGELVEYLYKDQLITENAYLDLIWSKTAAFMGACCHAGMLLGTLDSKYQEAAKKYGEKVGMAFQIVDDILDYTSSKDMLGKEVLADLREGKVTLPMIAALRTSQRNGNHLQNQIDGLRRGETDGRDISRFVQEYGGVEYASKLAIRLSQEAKSYLSDLPISDFRRSLAEVADYIVYRER